MDRVEEYFEQVRWLPQEIKELQLRMKFLREQANSISSTPYDRDIVTGTKDNRSPQEKLVMQLSEMEAEVNRKLKLSVTLQEQMDEVVESLASKQDQQVLRLHYIHNMNWETIGQIMNCAGKTAGRWCQLALSHVVLPADVIFIEDMKDV